MSASQAFQLYKASKLHNSGDFTIVDLKTNKQTHKQTKTAVITLQGTLYADDTTAFVQDLDSIPHLLTLLHKFIKIFLV